MALVPSRCVRSFFRVKSVLATVICLSAIGIVFVIIKEDMTSGTRSRSTYIHQFPGINGNDVQDERLRHIEEVCSDGSTFERRVYRRSSSRWITPAPRYNLAYCKVPKAGCTFLMQMFIMMEDGAQTANQMTIVSRAAIHGKAARMRVKQPRQLREASHSVLVSRDPYSRLYSAYVDKIYLPLMSAYAAKIVKARALREYSDSDTVTCGNNVTFKEFLQSIITDTKDGKRLDTHWAPIVSLCDPCHLSYPATLIKQETFSEDVERFLRDMDADDDVYDVIVDQLHDHRPEATIPGIVKVVLRHASRTERTVKCFTPMDIIERLWTSFQIQGYIHEGVQLPVKQFITVEQQTNDSYVSGVVLEAIRNTPITTVESKQQRRRALVGAYEGVKRRTIRGIHILYRQDFSAFDYDTAPPT